MTTLQNVRVGIHIVRIQVIHTPESSVRRRPGRDVGRQHAPHLDDEEFQGPAGASPLMANVELYSVVGRRGRSTWQIGSQSLMRQVRDEMSEALSLRLVRPPSCVIFASTSSSSRTRQQEDRRSGSHRIVTWQDPERPGGRRLDQPALEIMRRGTDLYIASDGKAQGRRTR